MGNIMQKSQNSYVLFVPTNDTAWINMLEVARVLKGHSGVVFIAGLRGVGSKYHKILSECNYVVETVNTVGGELEMNSSQQKTNLIRKSHHGFPIWLDGCTTC